MKKIILMTTCLVLSGCGTIEMTLSKDRSVPDLVKERVTMCKGLAQGRVCQSGGCFASQWEHHLDTFVAAETCQYIELENYGPVLACSMDAVDIQACDYGTVCRDWWTTEGNFRVPRCEEEE